MSDTEFFDWLTSKDGGGYSAAMKMPDGMWAGIKPLMFHWTLNTGVVGDTRGYEGRWCYADENRARIGMLGWSVRGFDGEPMGWKRHPETGRRRNDAGDPASEWVAP